jgi:hypothetical protein
MMSNAKGGAIQAMALVAGLGLAGCASGGGSSGSMMVVTPTPTPTSSSPTVFAFATPLNTYSASTPGSVSASQATAAPAATVTITDNDGAAGFGAVKFNGRQSVRVQIPSLSIDDTFAASTAVSVPTRDPRSGLSPAAGTVSLTSWESKRGNNDPAGFYIYGLQKGAPGTPLAATSYVSLGEWNTAAASGGPVASQTGAFVLLGTATPIMPVNGGATFSGQAYGRYVAGGSGSIPFLGAASLTVDFARSAGALTGSVDNAAYSNPSDPLRFTLLFSGDLNGANFTGAATASNAHGGTLLPAGGMSGPIQGGFFERGGGDLRPDRRRGRPQRRFRRQQISDSRPSRRG